MRYRVYEWVMCQNCGGTVSGYYDLLGDSIRYDCPHCGEHCLSPEENLIRVRCSGGKAK